MFKSALFILVLVFKQAAWADVTVDWACPHNSKHKTPIEISFDTNGKITFKPDIFSGTLKKGSVTELSNCIYHFQKNAHDRIVDFKKANCSSSANLFCTSRTDYVDARVTDKIKESHLAKTTEGIVVEQYVSGINRPKYITAAVVATSAEGQSTSVTTVPQVKKPVAYSITAQKFLEIKVKNKQINLNDLNKTFDYLGRTYKVSDFDKVIGDHIDELFNSMSQDEAKQYAQNYMVLNAAILKGTPSDKRTDVLNNLNQMMKHLYGDRGAEELAKLLECAPEDNLKPLTDILSHVESTQKINECTDLTPGKHKVFEHKDFYTTGDYLLKRNADGSYQAIVNVQFSKGGGSVSPADMMARAKKCLQNASLAMKGPNGEKLEFAVLSPEESLKLPADQRPKARNISIEGPRFSTNSAQYNETANCGVITHEMLHLLGLCDEYREDRAEFSSNHWTCRVQTNAPSIMRDTSLYDQAVPKSVQCKCDNDTCKKIMESGNEEVRKVYSGPKPFDVIGPFISNCPNPEVSWGGKGLSNPDQPYELKSSSNEAFSFEYREIVGSDTRPYYQYQRSRYNCKCEQADQDCLSKVKFAVEQIKNAKAGNTCPSGSSEVSSNPDGGANYKDGKFTINSTPLVKSLLQPSHFYKILYGNCKNPKVDNYNECAQWAYKDSSQEPSGKCNVPQHCRNDSYYLGSPQ